MTTGSKLGTSVDEQTVYDAIAKLHFEKKTVAKHKIIQGLRLQIHGPCYFKGVEGIVTEIEFDNLLERYPDDSRIIDVLKQLYYELPDLQYVENPYRLMFGDEPIVRSVSELLKKYSK